MYNHTLEQAKHHHVKYLLDYMLGGGELPASCNLSNYVITNGYEITAKEYEEIVTLAEMQYNVHPRNKNTH